MKNIIICLVLMLVAQTISASTICQDGLSASSNPIQNKSRSRWFGTSLSDQDMRDINFHFVVRLERRRRTEDGISVAIRDYNVEGSDFYADLTLQLGDESVDVRSPMTRVRMPLAHARSTVLTTNESMIGVVAADLVNHWDLLIHPQALELAVAEMKAGLTTQDISYYLEEAQRPISGMEPRALLGYRISNFLKAKELRNHLPADR